MRHAGAGIMLSRYLKEVSGSLLPVPLMHVHLATAFSDDAHDSGVGNGGLDGQGLVVQLAQLLRVLLLCVHLNLQCVDLQELCSLLQVV